MITYVKAPEILADSSKSTHFESVEQSEVRYIHTLNTSSGLTRKITGLGLSDLLN